MDNKRNLYVYNGKEIRRRIERRDLVRRLEEVENKVDGLSKGDIEVDLITDNAEKQLDQLFQTVAKRWF